MLWSDVEICGTADNDWLQLHTFRLNNQHNFCVLWLQPHLACGSAIWGWAWLYHILCLLVVRNFLDLVFPSHKATLSTHYMSEAFTTFWKINSWWPCRLSANSRLFFELALIFKKKKPTWVRCWMQKTRNKQLITVSAVARRPDKCSSSTQQGFGNISWITKRSRLKLDITRCQTTKGKGFRFSKQTEAPSLSCVEYNCRNDSSMSIWIQVGKIVATIAKLSGHWKGTEAPPKNSHAAGNNHYGTSEYLWKCNVKCTRMVV